MSTETSPGALAPGQDIDTIQSVKRAKIWHNVCVRLADEGVPVRAIVRALMLPFSEVREVLEAASERGMILSIPRDDWPPGTRRDERQPDTVPLEIEDDHMVMLTMRTFKLTLTMAKMFVALMRRPELTKSALHVVTQSDNGYIYPDKGKEPTHVKIVDVFVCKMRKLLPPDIKIITEWGRGYYIPVVSKEIAFKALGIKHDTFVIPAAAEAA